MSHSKTIQQITFIGLCLVLGFFASLTYAGDAQVVGAKFKHLGGNEYRFDVTLQHKDTGWDHYANAWLVYDMEGNLLGERVLYHPHVNEQPFTRSLTVSIPETINKVMIKAQDSVHGVNDKGFELQIK